MGEVVVGVEEVEGEVEEVEEEVEEVEVVEEHLAELLVEPDGGGAVEHYVHTLR